MSSPSFSFRVIDKPLYEKNVNHILKEDLIMLKGLILSLVMLGNTANVNTDMDETWKRWDRELKIIYFNTDEDRKQEYKEWYDRIEVTMTTDMNWNHIKVSEEMMENIKDKGEWDTSKDGSIEFCWIRNDLVVYCVH